jgi:hypothetical protein
MRNWRGGGSRVYDGATRIEEALRMDLVPEELNEYAGNRYALAQLPTLVQHGRADDMTEITKARELLKA